MLSYSNKSLDSEHFTRVDNAIVIDFLTLTASALHERESLSSKEIDDLRIHISSIQSNERQRSQPILLRLVEEGSPFVKLLLTHFGQVDLSSNLLRYSLTKATDALIASCAAAGSSWLEKVRIVFNRDFPIYEGSQLIDRALASAVFNDLTSIIENACTFLNQQNERLRCLCPGPVSSREQYYDDNRAIASALGFKDLDATVLPHLYERSAIRTIDSKILDIHEACAFFLRHVATDLHEEATLECSLILSELETLRAALRAFLPGLGQNDLHHCELYRHRLLCSILSISSAFQELGIQIERLIPRAAIPDQRATFPARALEQIRLNLVKSGCDIRSAEQAVDDLVRYCQLRNIRPRAIIPEELPKINAALTACALELFQGLCDSKFSMASTQFKKAVELHSQALGNFLKKFESPNLSHGFVIAFICFASTFCGVKTAPVSDMDDYRPQVPIPPADTSKEPQSVERKTNSQQPVRNPNAKQ